MSLTVIKIGGHALDASKNAELLLDSMAQDLAQLHAEGQQVVLVHGGGPQINEILSLTGVVSSFVNGLRVTDAATLRAVVMGLSHVNAKLCAALGARGLRVVGCNGTTDRLIQASVNEDSLGFVGGNIKANVDFLRAQLELGLIPIVAPFGGDTTGQLLNCNADAAAGAIAGALSADALVLLSDIDQVRTDPSDASTGVARMNVAEAQALIATGAAKEGMVPKIDSALVALSHGASKVVIANGSRPHAIRDVLNQTTLQTEVVA